MEWLEHYQSAIIKNLGNKMRRIFLHRILRFLS